MKTYFIKDPLYQERFSQVWLWAEWAALKPDFDGTDTGIDLVAEEREGGYCAIQCKCYAPGTQISKPHLDSFIAASARDPFTARIMVDTGDEWGPNAVKTIAPLKPACAVLRFGDLASRPFDWPDLVHGEPEALTYRRELFSLRPHQKTALDDVTGGFKARDRGKLVMACGTGKTFAALRIAEAVAGVGGRVLYLVPSISLFQQSMREWATRSYDGPIDLIVDSTGLKIPGCGEWNAHKHKASKKRRDWRKLHIGVDAEGFIVAAELTASSRDDASTLPALLDTIEVPIRRFTADGAYDHRSVYDRASAAGTENVVIVIPPLVAPRCRRGQRTAPGRSVTRLLRGFARSGDESGRRSRATDSRRALKTASSDTSPCSEAD